MTARKLNFMTDPGHGWLEVPRADLAALGINGAISGYSYTYQDKVYLEEDCDAGLYVQAAKANGWAVDIVNHHTNQDHWIRNLKRYQATA